MTETDPNLIKQQGQFVQWMQDRGIYNPMTSANEMLAMFRIWRITEHERYTPKGPWHGQLKHYK